MNLTARHPSGRNIRWSGDALVADLGLVTQRGRRVPIGRLQ